MMANSMYNTRIIKAEFAYGDEEFPPPPLFLQHPMRYTSFYIKTK